MKKFEVILCIVNAGFADRAMDAARAAGAKGGTILHGRGTAAPDAERLFGVTVHPEKEIVMILVAGTVRDAVMKSLYDTVGSGTEAQGIAFTLPVEQTVGLGSKSAPAANAEKSPSK
jgi:hypothetical protein